MILAKQNENDINEDLTPELRQELKVRYVQFVSVEARALTPASPSRTAHARRRPALPAPDMVGSVLPTRRRYFSLKIALSSTP